MSTISTRPASVSLIIPSYNRAELILQTIDSALAQSRPFLEIIVADDGSTDNTAEVLARYGDKVTFLALDHTGVQAARNKGADIARGDYLAFCDSDDLLDADFVEKMFSWLDDHADCDAVYGNFVTFNNDGKTHPDKFSLAPPGYFADAQSEGDFIYHFPDLYLRTIEYQPLFMSGVVVRRAFYQKIGGFDTDFKGVGGEDWEFTLRVVALGKVAICKRVLARIRKHDKNDSADSIHMAKGTADILEYVLKAHPVANQYRAAIMKEIDIRRAGVFDAAFAGGNFSLAKKMLGTLRTQPTNKKFKLKVFITYLPTLLRQPLWRITQ